MWYLQNHPEYKEKTIRNYLSSLNSFKRAISDVPVEEIGTDYILRWDRDMQLRGISATARNTDLSKMRQVLSAMSEAGLRVMDKQKIKLPKRDTKPSEYLTPFEVKQLIDACKNTRDKAICALIFNTGGRVSEVLNLNRNEFEAAEITREGVYTIWVCGKGDKYREVAFNTQTKVLVERYLDKRTDKFKPLFISGQNSRITVQRVEQIIHEAAALAGLEKRVTPHVLRHSYTTDLIFNGAPIKDVQHLLGHAKISTTLDIYTHRIDSRKHETQQKYQSIVL